MRLSEIFKGNYSKILELFLDHPCYGFTTAEAARHTDSNRQTATKIVSYFSKIGVLKKSGRLGNGQLYVLNTDNPSVKYIMSMEFNMSALEIPIQIPVKAIK